MKPGFQVAHAWGRYCKKCKNIFSIDLEYCPSGCDCGEVKMVRVMCAIQVPAGCIFVYDDGRIPGSQHWTEVTDEEYVKWHKAVSHSRPGT